MFRLEPVLHWEQMDPTGGMPAGGAEMAPAPEGDEALPSPETGEAEPLPEAPPATAPQPLAPQGEQQPPAAPSYGPPDQYGQAIQQIVGYGQQLQMAYAQLEAQEAAARQSLQQLAALNLAPEQQQVVADQYRAQLAARQQQMQEMKSAYVTLQSQAQQLYGFQQLAQKEAVLNRVGEPIAYQLLADRAAQETGDPEFPKAALMAELKKFPPDALVPATEMFKSLHRQFVLKTRSAASTDRMGPSGGAGDNWRQKSGRDLVREAAAEEFRTLGR